MPGRMHQYRYKIYCEEDDETPPPIIIIKLMLKKARSSVKESQESWKLLYLVPCIVI